MSSRQLVRILRICNLALILFCFVTCACPEQWRTGVRIPADSAMEVLGRGNGLFFTLRGSERVSRSQLREVAIVHSLIIAPDVEIRGSGSKSERHCLRATETFTWKLGHYQRGPFTRPDQKLVLTYDGSARKVSIANDVYDTAKGNCFIIRLDPQWRPHVTQLSFVRVQVEDLGETIAALREAFPQVQELHTPLYDEVHRRSAR